MQENISFSSGNVDLEPSPINPEWILEGNPIARAHTLSYSRNGSFSVIWDCSAGRFNWFYGLDETVYIIEGTVVLKGADGMQRRVGPGETVHFPAGTHAEWLVEKYVRKVAFLSNPRSVLRRAVGKGWRLTKRFAGVRGAESAPGMIHSI